jgi:hypothetical protein
VTHEQTEAHNATCELLDNRITPIDFCVMLFSRDYVNAYEPFPVEEAIQDALTRFYLSRVDKGEAVDMTRVLQLLDRMAESKVELEYAQRKFLILTYFRLGLFNEAVYAFYVYALSTKKRDHVTSSAEALLEAKPGFAQLPDFQWVVKRFGEK